MYHSCGEVVFTRYNHDVKCGDHEVGRGKVFCEKCHAKNMKEYPQGWDYYPGDICKHGVYVGGCGADYMCGACENGED